MHEIFETLIPKIRKEYTPTYQIIINVQRIYDESPRKTLNLLKNFQKFREEFKNFFINKLKLIETQTKPDDSQHVDYFLIKGNKELESDLSIHSYTNLEYRIINLPAFLFYQEISNLNGVYFKNIKNILKENEDCDGLINHFKRVKDKIIVLKGNLILKSKKEVLRYKVLKCFNDKCLNRNIYLITYRNNKTTVYLKEEGHYFLVLSFKKKCFTCKLKLQEDLKMRFIEEIYEYIFFDGLYEFYCRSKNKIEGNLIIGNLSRSGDGQLIFNILTSMSTILRKEDFLNTNLKYLPDNLKIEENDHKEYLKRLTFFHYKFLKRITQQEIVVFLILNLFFYFDCSVIFFTNEVEYLKILTKHFIKTYNLNTKIHFELDTEKGVYILDRRFFTLNNKNKEILEISDFLFKLYFENSSFTNLKEIKIKEKREILINQIDFDPKFFNSEFENLSKKFFKKEISSEKTLKHLTSFFIIFQNIFCEENNFIFDLIEKYFLNVIF